MNKLKLVNTINIQEPFNILPNEDSHIICSDNKLDINGYKLNIKSRGIRFSNEGYLYCCNYINDKIYKIDNFEIKNSYNINHPYDILINNNEIIIESKNKYTVYDSSLNEIKTLNINYGRMNINMNNDIFICDYYNNKIKVYSYNYDFKYSIDIKRPCAVAIINDTIFIENVDSNLYCYTDKLEYTSICSDAYFIQSENNKLYVPQPYRYKINVYELIQFFLKKLNFNNL